MVGSVYTNSCLVISDEESPSSPLAPGVRKAGASKECAAFTTVEGQQHGFDGKEVGAPREGRSGEAEFMVVLRQFSIARAQ